jgi:hypothetical protein
LTIRLETVNDTATEVSGETGSFKLVFEGDVIPKDLRVPLDLKGNAAPASDYRLETIAWNPETMTYESLILTNNLVPVRLKPGDMSLPVKLIPLSDGKAEAVEFAEVGLFANGDLYNLSDDRQAIFSIQDGLDQISISARRNSLCEGDNIGGEIVLSRKGSIDTERIVKLKVQGSAENGIDCKFIPSGVLIPAGEREVTIPVLAYLDTQTEPVEYLEIIITPGEGYVVSGIASASVAINDASTRGDIDGNGSVDLADAIIALKILAGKTNASIFIHDVNADGRIGLEEALFIFQKLSELRK